MCLSHIFVANRTHTPAQAAFKQGVPASRVGFMKLAKVACLNYTYCRR